MGVPRPDGSDAVWAAGLEAAGGSDPMAEVAVSATAAAAVLVPAPIASIRSSGMVNPLLAGVLADVSFAIASAIIELGSDIPAGLVDAILSCDFAGAGLGITLGAADANEVASLDDDPTDDDPTAYPLGGSMDDGRLPLPPGEDVEAGALYPEEA